MKKLIIAGINSGVGKTTITSALMKSFTNVAPFKIGPDYIDTSFHSLATGNPSYNLDLFLLSETELKNRFYEKSKDKNIAIIEGVMGLYDGLNHKIDNFSTAHVARVLNCPVILIVDGHHMSTSLAATILGFSNFDKRVNIVGVILNNVNSHSSYIYLKDAIEKHTGNQCLGYFPTIPKLKIEERHLGLLQAQELNAVEEYYLNLKNQAKESLDLARIYELSTSSDFSFPIISYGELKNLLSNKKIGIAKDRAFSFYYQSNLDLLKFCGAEIVYFSPIKDKSLPENLDFLYLGGGYPEIYGKELQMNTSMKTSICNFSKTGKIYAECGGFIYLTKGIWQLDGSFSEFLGVLDIEIEMKSSLDISRFGYVNIEINENLKTRGHEFHYSRIKNSNEKNMIYKVSKPSGNSWSCGFSKNSVLGSYAHIDFYSNLDFFKHLFNI